jgi:hypothetical protein
MKQHIELDQLETLHTQQLENLSHYFDEIGFMLLNDMQCIIVNSITIGKMIEILESSSIGQKLLISKLIEYNQALTMGIEWKYSFCDALWKAVKSILSSKP